MLEKCQSLILVHLHIDSHVASRLFSNFPQTPIIYSHISWNTLNMIIYSARILVCRICPIGFVLNTILSIACFRDKPL